MEKTAGWYCRLTLGYVELRAEDGNHEHIQIYLLLNSTLADKLSVGVGCSL